MPHTFAYRFAGLAAAIALAAGAVGFASPTARAQDAGDATGSAEAPAYTDAKLESYVLAAVDVSRVVGEWRPRLESARQEGDAEALDALRQQAMAELTGVVESADGISVEEYRAITEAARQDSALLDRIRDKMAEVVPDQG